MKKYIGEIDYRGPKVYVAEDNGKIRGLPLYLEEVCHSPTGFSWGYGGSGPAQLAYAILRDMGLEPREARALYMAFKNDVIARLKYGESFTLTEEEVRNWIEKVRQRRQGLSI